MKIHTHTQIHMQYIFLECFLKHWSHHLCLCMCTTCVYQAVLCSSLSPSEDLVRHLEILKGGISYKKVFPMLKIGNNPMMQGVRSLYDSTKGHLETGQLKAGIIN